MNTPPHDELAERCVLGSMLMSARAISDVSAVMSPEDFYVPKHQWIYESVLQVQQAGEPVDPVTLANDLQTRGHLGKVGGAPYLLTLAQDTPNPSSASYYAAIVRDKATFRRLIEAGTRVTQLGYTDADVEEVVERARAELDKLTAQSKAVDTLELADLLPTALDELQQAKTPGIPTGFLDLDDLLNGGLHPGGVTVIGARPGVGKSILALRIAAHVAAKGYGSLMVSLEMPRAELMNRFLASESAVELTSLNAHRLSADDWFRVSRTADRAREWPLAVVDAPRIGLTGITSRARDRLHTPRGLSVVTVDYLQLVQPSDSRATREQQVSGISRGLKLMAMELGVHVVVAAQLNRGAVGVERRPVISDLRESGSIEQDADTVILLYDDPAETAAGEMELIVAKNRHGRKGTVVVAWKPYYATAKDLARHEEAS